MSEFKGTPGEWGFSHNSASDSTTACIEITSTESVHSVAMLQSTDPNISHYYEPTSFDRTIANAHLIAVAPKLLKALQEMVEAMEDENPLAYAEIISQSKSVIAEALGE